MTKVKICGLYREEDILYVNEAKPDYAGFIINFPKSHRSIQISTLRRLKEKLNPEILAVGVFVNQPLELIADIAKEGLIDLIQLHGEEDEAYIRKLQMSTGKKIIRAFQVQNSEVLSLAEKSVSDEILLDSGQGSGTAFSWQLLKDFKRPFFLAGGLSGDNIAEAVKKIRPRAVDISSGVETAGKKDVKKIMEIVKQIRDMDRRWMEETAAKQE